jgi:hypothetical protein
MRAKTIQIFLTDGSPRGVKVVDITSNIEQAIFIPRPKINEVLSRQEAYGAGIYFLFGENNDSARPMVYMGESMNCLERIKTHDQKKDFWHYAIIIVSKTKSFSQTHIEYLEELAISMAYEANRYVIENTISPKKFAVPETLEADLLDNFDTIKILLSTLGFPLFDAFDKSTQAKDILICKGKDAVAEGEYLDDGFVVYKNSKANKELAPACTPTIRNLRDKLLKQNILVEKNGILEFQEDYLFSSPSSAATQVLSRNANGWHEWKYKNGKTLDEVKRK